MTPSPTAADLELLRAIDAGHVALRRHRHGADVRRADIPSKGRAGHNGLKVTAHAQRLQAMGLAEPGDPITTGDPFRRGDVPWRVTVNGRLELARHAAKERDRT
jgi:hypothetical protein